MRLFEGTPFDRPPRCDRCDELLEECRCPPTSSPRRAPAKQTAQVRVERRAKGKMVTIIRGLSSKENDLDDLLKQLKTACGAGGTLHQDELEVQGDQVERIRALLERIGYRVRT